MATKTVDITEAQSSLPELVSLANAGVEVVLHKEQHAGCLSDSDEIASGHLAGVSGTPASHGVRRGHCCGAA